MTRPATWFSPQGAIASPVTGTIGLAPGNQRHETPRAEGFVVFPTDPSILARRSESLSITGEVTPGL